MPPNASQRDWSSSMIEISTRPTCGIFLPFISLTICASSASPLPLKSQVKPRYSGFASSVIFDERTQFVTLYGPVPTGLVALLSALLGSTMMAVAWPIRNRKSGSSALLRITTVWSSTAATRSMLAKVRLSLLVLFSEPARSNENLTALALNGSPFWNFTPFRSLNV